MVTSKSAVRAARKKAAKAERGSKNVPTSSINSHVGICKRCDRTGLVNDEGICTGIKLTDRPQEPYEPRSKRCDAIVDNRTRKEEARAKSRGISGSLTSD